MASSNSAGLSETLELLTHPYRRTVLYYLRTHSEAVAIDTLSAMLATELEGRTVTIGNTTTEDIEVALRHTHLPKLADAGLITFAQNRQTIELEGMNGHGQFIDQAAGIDGYAPPSAGD